MSLLAPSPHEPTKWTLRLALDIALCLENSGEDVSSVLQSHGLTPQQLLDFRSDPVFLRKINEFRTEIREKGLTFRLKARTQAEELLKTSWLLIHQPDVSPAVKADLIKSTVKWAGLEPPASAGAGGEGAQSVRITINLGSPEPKVIESTPA